jgi:hypothetical protein
MEAAAQPQPTTFITPTNQLLYNDQHLYKNKMSLDEQQEGYRISQQTLHSEDNKQLQLPLGEHKRII